MKSSLLAAFSALALLLPGVMHAQEPAPSPAGTEWRHQNQGAPPHGSFAAAPASAAVPAVIASAAPKSAPAPSAADHAAAAQSAAAGVKARPVAIGAADAVAQGSGLHNDVPRRRAQTGGWSSHETTRASCSPDAAIGDGMVTNNEQAVIAHVEQQHATAGGAETVPGHVTYQVILTMAGTAENLYAIYCDTDRPLVLPPAFQIDPPFGSNLGIVVPAFWEICPSHQCKFDSWLTLQAPHDTSTSQQLGLSSIGVEFADVCMDPDSTAWSNTAA